MSRKPRNVSAFSLIEVAFALFFSVILICFMFVMGPSDATGDSVLFPVCHNGEPLFVATEAIQAGHLSHGDYESCEGRCCYRLDGLYVTDNMVESDCAMIEGSRYFPNPNSPCFGGGD